jgi:SAM-dependent methyltransferase
MIIEPRHFEYLAIQRGEVSDERHDFRSWKSAYERSLLRIFSSIRNALPNRCDSVLDIGSGLGGIDVLLARHYGGLHVCLLDGIDCEAHVHRHAEPFSNREVALDFQARNGNTDVAYCWPMPPTRTFDLIVSFAAWCFHIEPARYIDAVKAAMHDGTVLIFDVRSRSDWHDELRAAFGRPVILHQEQKYFRMAFNCAQQSLSRAAGA